MSDTTNAIQQIHIGACDRCGAMAQFIKEDGQVTLRHCDLAQLAMDDNEWASLNVIKHLYDEGKAGLPEAGRLLTIVKRLAEEYREVDLLCRVFDRSGTFVPDIDYTYKGLAGRLYAMIESGLPQWCVDVIYERHAQDNEWGGPDHDDEIYADGWHRILLRHVPFLLDGRALPRADYRQRLVKIAAVAVAAIESYDRKGGMR